MDDQQTDDFFTNICLKNKYENVLSFLKNTKIYLYSNEIRGWKFFFYHTRMVFANKHMSRTHESHLRVCATHESHFRIWGKEDCKKKRKNDREREDCQEKNERKKICRKQKKKKKREDCQEKEKIKERFCKIEELFSNTTR